MRTYCIVASKAKPRAASSLWSQIKVSESIRALKCMTLDVSNKWFGEHGAQEARHRALQSLTRSRSSMHDRTKTGCTGRRPTRLQHRRCRRQLAHSRHDVHNDLCAHAALARVSMTRAAAPPRRPSRPGMPAAAPRSRHFSTPQRLVDP